MSERRRYHEYDEATTERCERALITLIGDLGPWGEHAGAKFAAFNIRGAQLVRRDFVEHELEGERLDEGGRSKVIVRVANILIYTALKILAFQDRHDNKDAYDLVFTLLNAEDGPKQAGLRARESSVAGHEQVEEALVLLEERFADVDQDGPSAYAGFLARPSDEGVARLRQEAVATVRAFLRGFRD